jgi:hypothetical protein
MDKAAPLSKMRSIRHHCVWCCLGQHSEVTLCASTDCSLHPYRAGRLPGIPEQSPLTAIWLRCLDCVGGNFSDVDKCKSKDCPLYAYRFGKNPNYSEAAPGA